MPTAEISDTDWQDQTIPALVDGFTTEFRPDVIKDGNLTRADNVFYDKAWVKVDTGFATFQGTVEGIPRLTYQFFKTNGTSELILITDATVYKQVSDTWHYVAGLGNTTAASGEPAEEDEIDVVDETGFSVDDLIGIILDDGTQHQTTCTAVAANTVTIDDAIPAGRTVPLGYAVVAAPNLSGVATDQISIATLPGQDWVVFANGQDNVQRYDGTDCIDVPNLPSSGNTQCKVVALFHNHLLLINTAEGGTAYPQRIRWSDTGDPENWTTGNASYVDLLDSEDFLTAASPLGPHMILYKDRSIIRQEYVGEADRLFNFETMVQGEGALAQDAVSNLGDFHLFVGQSNIYKYRGSFDIEPTGDEIYTELFSISGNLDPTHKGKTFVIYVEEVDEVWVFFTSTGDSYPRTIAKYKQGTGAWAFRHLPLDIVGFGFWQKDTSVPWSSMVGSWEEQNTVWNAHAFLANSPTTLLCGVSPKQVYEFDYIQTTDNGTTIDFTLDTKDFTDPGYKLLIDNVQMATKGAFTLMYSEDQGDTWTTYDTVDQSTYQRITLWTQFEAERVRWRITGSQAGFRLGWFKFEWQRMSAW